MCSRPAAHHAGAVFAADDEPGFLQRRDDEHAMSLAPDRIRNPFRSVPELRENRGRVVELFDVVSS